MGKTPKQSKKPFASPSTVGKLTKKDKNPIDLLQSCSQSMLSSICTPKRMTRSVAKAVEEMPPPKMSPLVTNKKTAASSSTKKTEKSPKHLVSLTGNSRKSKKLFKENNWIESDETQSTVNLLGNDINVPTSAKKDDEATTSSSISDEKIKSKAGKGRKTKKILNESNLVQSDDGLPTVSLLGNDLHVKTPAKTEEAPEIIASQNIDGSAAKEKSKTGKGRKSMKILNESNLIQSDDVLLPVSLLDNDLNVKIPAKTEEAPEIIASQNIDGSTTKEMSKAGKGRKSMKILNESNSIQNDAVLPSVSMLGGDMLNVDTPAIFKDLIELKSSAKITPNEKKPITESEQISSVIDKSESVLNTTFDKIDDIEEMPSSNGKKSAAQKRVSVIDLTESPMAKKLDATFSPLPKIAETSGSMLDSSIIDVNDCTFTEEMNPVESVPSNLKSTKKSTPKSMKRISPKLKRLQAKTPAKKATPPKMSTAKKVKILEAAKSAIKEKPSTVTSTLKKTPAKLNVHVAEQSKPSPFNFVAAASQKRVFNFDQLKGSKIPTFKELEKMKNENKMKELKKSAIKSVPNFKAIHERMFEKDIALNDIENHKSIRADFVKSGHKFNTEENQFKPADPKSKRKLNLNGNEQKAVVRAPLVAQPVNKRAKLNADQREERRKMMFKQGSTRRESIKAAEKVKIQNVKTNRRFDLLMKYRQLNATKN